MKNIRRWTRILILSLLAVSVSVPIFLHSYRLKNLNHEAPEEYIEDLSSIKHRNSLKLSAIEKEVGESLKERPLVVYTARDSSSAVTYRSDGNIRSDQSGYAKSSGTNMLERSGANKVSNQDYQKIQLEEPSSKSEHNEQTKQTTVLHNENARPQEERVLDEKIQEMKDQLNRAGVYLKFAPPNSNSQLVKELKLQSKELKQAVGNSTKDSDLPRRAVQKMRAMEATLLKASRVYSDCPAIATKLRSLTFNAEDQIQAQKNKTAFLIQIAGRTNPKGLHCLSLRLTIEYFSLQPEEREFPNQQNLHDQDLHHFAVFSDNILACAVVVNSTISTSREPEKMVFHVVTGSFNLPAMSMWFLSNPPGKSTMKIMNIDSFAWLFIKHDTKLQKQQPDDPRYTSALNHLRFYLPDVFPMLNKIVFLDHDVVVQRDLTGLWSVDMKGKVNGAVATCQEGESSFQRMDKFANSSDPKESRSLDHRTCIWAFGMNVFDLQEWRRQNLTGVYHKCLQLANKRPFLNASSLPLDQLTFENYTLGLDRTWHVRGLGYDSGVSRGDIEQAAVIHFDGIMKPWLDIGLKKYRNYWRRHVNYEHPYLQKCNIHK